MRFSARIGFLASLLPMVVGATDLLSPGLTAEQVQEKLTTPGALLVVDVRKPPEYAIAHIPGAVNIPLAELPQRLNEVRSDSGVLVYCLNGSRTRKAEHILYENNINDVYHLEGAFEMWLRDKYPIEKGGVKKSGW